MAKKPNSPAPVSPVPDAAPGGEGESAEETLDAFTQTMQGTGGADAGAAAGTLAAAEATLIPPPAPEAVKRSRGRPKGSATRPRETAQPVSSSAAPGTNYDRMTKADLIALAQSQDARIGSLQPANVPGEAEIAEARKTVEGLLELANLALTARNVPEFVTTADETDLIAQGLAEPIAPYLRQLGAAQPWVRAGAVLLMVYAPKTTAYLQRVEAEKRGQSPDLRGKTEIVTESDARTASGGFTGAT